MKIIHTEKAPAAVGPYSQAIVIGDLVYTSGQIPLDPATGNIVQGDVQAQTEQEQKTMEQQAAAERDVIAAEAEANVKKIEADAAAYAVTVQAQAEADANAKIAASLTPELIDYNEIEQWDGKLPEIYGADSVIPVLGDEDVTETTNP